jgi:hypothetical protein
MRDVERYAILLRANPLFRPDFSEIVDLTEVEEVSLQGEEFLRLADKVDPFSYDAKRAFVARSSVQNHAARMHKILRTQRNIEIFHRRGCGTVDCVVTGAGGKNSVGLGNPALSYNSRSSYSFVLGRS